MRVKKKLLVSAFAAVAFGSISIPSPTQASLTDIFGGGVIHLPTVPNIPIALPSVNGIRLDDVPGVGRNNPITFEKLAVIALRKQLENEVPTRIDVRSAFRSVPRLPGAPFTPHSLRMSGINDLSRPLRPGDYTFGVIGFCSAHSAGVPSRGLPYTVGTLSGKAAAAASAMLFRGIYLNHSDIHELQATFWTIQAGLPYAAMPDSYKKIIDSNIPEYRGKLNGDYIAGFESRYDQVAKTAHLPALDTLLRNQLGDFGHLILAARAERGAVLQQYRSQADRTRRLFALQGAPVQAGSTPLSEPPWTERIPGRLYVRYRVVSGYSGRNEVDVRVVPSRVAAVTGGAGFTPVTPFDVFFTRPPSVDAHRAASRLVAANDNGTPDDGPDTMIAYPMNSATQPLTSVPAPDSSASPEQAPMPEPTSTPALFRSVLTNEFIRDSTPGRPAPAPEEHNND